MVRIAEIEAGSIAEELSLEIGTRIIRINGERVRDGIDLTFLLSDTELELETVGPDGSAVVYEIERDPGTPVGIVPAPEVPAACGHSGPSPELPAWITAWIAAEGARPWPPEPHPEA